jgi:hypothetical protein
MTRDELIKAAYDEGFKDCLWAYAHQRDGTYYVGTTGTSHASAMVDRRKCFNYRAPEQDELEKR